MSAASAIAGTSGSSALAALGQDRLSQMSGQDFINLMVSQLTHQDPLKPADSQQILEQLSSVRNIESQVTLQNQLKALVSQEQIAQAGGMIGKMVDGLDANGGSVTGVVTSVRVVDGNAVLELDSGKSLPMNRVTRIADASTAGTNALPQSV